MYRKIVTVWVSLAMIYSIILIVDVTMDFTLNAGGTTLFVNTTGSGGAYTKIQDAINESSDGDMIYVFNGTYYENVVVNKTINLIGENRDTTIIDGGEHGDVINITVDWVNITGFKIKNSGIEWFYNAGIELSNVDNCQIINNNITNNKYGIHLWNSNYNHIKDNIILNSNSYGIQIINSNNNNITGNIAINNSRGIYQFSWDSTPVVNSTICNNIFSDNVFGIVLSSSKNCTIFNNCIISNEHIGVLFSNCTNSTISSNYINNNTEGVYLGSSSIHNNISNNNLIGNTDYGIHIGNSRSNTIINNTVSESYLGIYLGGSDNNDIISNNLSNNHVGIRTHFYCDKNKIMNNLIMNNSIGIQIVSNCDLNIISNNTIVSSEVGIRHHTNTNTTIINNTISLCKSDGLFIYSSSNVTISNNTVSSCKMYGIILHHSSNNTVFNNTVYNNEWGIYCKFTSRDNLIYHNNFISNKNQTYEDNPNIWNASYPIGGNYWSNYIGIDKFSGPKQNLPGVDGFGDTPYIINNNSKDNYPLMTPTIGNCTYFFPGWNLISIPFILSDTNLGVVFNSIKGSYDAAQWYNISDTSDHWKHNCTKKPSYLNDLNRIDHTKGIWIHITEPGGILFQYPGTKPMANQTINIHPGWNLIGYPSITSYNRTEGLNNLTFGSDVDAIWTYNAATQKWIELGPSNNFEVGRGYWIHSKVTKIWIVPL